MAERQFEPGSKIKDADEERPKEPVQLTQELAQDILKRIDEAPPLDEVIDPQYLKFLTKASGGFSFHSDRNLAIKSLTEGRIYSGYTEMNPDKPGGRIFFNPLLRVGIPELGIEPWSDIQIEGFSAHEAGHHAEEVRELQDRLLAALANPDLIPEAYQGDPNTEQRFLAGLHSHLNNGVADVWDESFMSRRPYRMVENAINSLQGEKGGIEDHHDLSRPEQLIQVLLKGRFHEDPKIMKAMKSGKVPDKLLESNSLVKGKISPETWDQYKRILSSGAMKALMDTKIFEVPSANFATPAQLEAGIDRKFNAWQDVFLPAYLDLVEEEIEQRKKQKQEERAARSTW